MTNWKLIVTSFDKVDSAKVKKVGDTYEVVVSGVINSNSELKSYQFKNKEVADKVALMVGYVG